MDAFINVKNVRPSRSGVGLGLLDTCYGLSSVVFSQLYELFFASEHDLAGFFLFQSIAVFVCGIVGVAVCYVPFHTQDVDDAETRVAARKGLTSPVYLMLFVAMGLVQMTMAWHVGTIANQIS